MTNKRTLRVATSAAAFVATLGLLPVLAAAQDAAPGAAQGQAVEGDRTAGEPPTAEDMLKELRRARPINDVISPASGAWSGDAAAKRKLWPEGWALVDRSGFLNREGDWWLFAFDPADGDPPMRLIPNANLEVLVRTATHATSPVRFVISGSTTVYEDRNYLLVRSVTRDRHTPPATKHQKHSGAMNHPKPVSVTASSDDVMNMMQGEMPVSDVMDTRRERFGSATVASATRTLQPDGATIINRPARVVRQGSMCRLVFESDHPDSPEPPLTILPNQNMMRMVKLAAADNLGLVFIVSGEVTQFQGENFVLVQASTQRMASGNFRK